MLFEPNDINNAINRGNYEEFFILYLDNELSEEQKKMVDTFVITHPDLKGELDILMSTKLPLEEFSFNKDELFASNMRLSSVEEELLLYIDNELTVERKNSVERELASNKDYQLQHQVLLQMKLDPSEKIVYPNKEELYRRTKRVVYLTPWMRVAVAVVIIAMVGMFYFRNSSSTTVGGTQDPQITANKPRVKQNEIKEDANNKQTGAEDHFHNDQLANGNSVQDKKRSAQEPQNEKELDFENKAPQNETAFNESAFPEIITSEKKTERTTFIEAGNDSGEEMDPQTSVANALNKDFINSHDVTSITPGRTPNEPPVDQKGLTAGSSNRKGSVKGFLRRATRMIEKRTGFDPTNDNGQLLIGSVAINLK